MKLRIISPGRVKDAWLQAGLDDYGKRLRRYSQVVFDLVNDAPDQLPLERALREEADRILGRIRSQDFVVLLDLGAAQMSSEQFAAQLMNWMEAGGSEVVFVIGGSRGLADEVRGRAQIRMAVSDMTFTHQMSRLLLLEQCYRAFRIVNNAPYHK